MPVGSPQARRKPAAGLRWVAEQNVRSSPALDRAAPDDPLSVSHLEAVEARVAVTGTALGVAPRQRTRRREPYPPDRNAADVAPVAAGVGVRGSPVFQATGPDRNRTGHSRVVLVMIDG